MHGKLEKKGIDPMMGSPDLVIDTAPPGQLYVHYRAVLGTR